MLNYVKKGFGFAFGSMLCIVGVYYAHEKIMRWGASDKEFMEFEKTHNPELYEKLKKYE